VISEIHDGRTRDLTRAGLSSGHRFVEFGCGLGYVTRWAATRARPSWHRRQRGADRRPGLAPSSSIVEFRAGGVYGPVSNPGHRRVVFALAAGPLAAAGRRDARHLRTAPGGG
jgi:hypothetical protein